MTYRRHKWVGLVLFSLLLASCNFSSDDEAPKPTVGTPIVESTALTGTVAPETTPVVTVPSVTAAPSLTPGSTTENTATAASPTPPPSFTPVINVPLTQAPLLTPTNTPMGIITFTVAPTFTSPPPMPSTTPTQYVAPPTFTPVIVPQTPVSPSPIPPSAAVCVTCGNLRLRESPGTAGNIITMLAANTPLTIIGRTEDTVWVQVVTPDGASGWVAAEYLVINIDLSVVSVTGTALNAPTQPALVSPAGIDVVSGVSSHARQIFLNGLAKGNLARSFTRVGDSITVAPFFLSQFAGGVYNLGDYGYLQGALNFFAGPNGRGANPFGSASMAAGNGWGTTSILDPANANPNLCRPGETPLECEYRVNRPSVALIMIGTNDSGGLSPATYRANLQRIVDISINMGVIPVLSTIPPKHYDQATDGRVDEFNQIIVATARAYDIPLWNYWDSMRGVPGEGLSSDGVHPSLHPDGISTIFDADHLNYGYTVRNLGALQVLYTLWQQVLYDADQAVPATSLPASNNPNPPVVVDPGSGDCLGAPPPRLTVGGQGRITPGLPNKVRNAPATTAAQVGTIPGEGVFLVLDGPHCADGFNWWQVNYNGLIGWTASGNAEEYWVEPYP